jgi:hypothetical protein
MTLERQNAELMRRLAAREATIVELGKELDAQNDQAWELVNKAIKLLEEYGK